MRNTIFFAFVLICSAARVSSLSAQSQLPSPNTLIVNTYQDAVRLEWTIPTANDDLIATLQGYNVYRNDTQLNDTPVETLYYIDREAEEATSYSYFVTALYTSGESLPTEIMQINVPRHGAPVNVATSISADGIDITWDALAQYPANAQQFVEDFSRYDPTAQSSLTEMLDGWTMYNGEPQRNHKYTDGSAWGIRKDTDDNIYLTGSYIAGYSMPLNDWIISPLLSTAAQTISLRASKSYAQYPESFVVKYSTNTTSIEDFIDLPGAMVSDSELSTEWRDFSFTLPVDTKYFAIVCTSTEGDRLKLDDISYIPAVYPSSTLHRIMGTLMGYNVYVNGKNVNNEPVADTHFVYAPGHAGEFSVTVSGVYTTYETPESPASQLYVDASKVVLCPLNPESFTQREELGNIYISWEEPLPEAVNSEWSEDFDSCATGPFTASSSGFTAINRSGVNHVTDGVGYNPFIIRKTGGETFLFTSCAPTGIDDWLISPYHTNMKSVAFKAQAEYQSEERVELYYSDKDSADPADFTLVKTFDLPKYTSGSTWIDCESELPESACRFALRACTPTYGNGIRIDDISWNCGSDNIISNVVGYNLYHRVVTPSNIGSQRKSAPDGYVRINDGEYRTWKSERGVEAHYTTSVPGTHQFAISAQYPWGESEPAYVEDLVVTGIEDVELDAVNGSADLQYFSIDGRRIASPASGQIVIVRTPSSSYKIIW